MFDQRRVYFIVRVGIQTAIFSTVILYPPVFGTKMIMFS